MSEIIWKVLEQGKVIGVGVNIYVCSWKKNNLNHTLAIDSQ